MGLLPSEIIKFLQEAREKGIKGKTLAMMGKQDILVEWDPFMKTVKNLGFRYDPVIADKIKGQRNINAFDLFHMFGFEEVNAVDRSGYEGADIIFDLNDTLPGSLRKRFDYVINGGTLEHVFDVANAMKNMSEMVKDNGMIMHIAPAAGWVDHGFYSISPTFFQDYYSANGFMIKHLMFEFILSQMPDSSGLQRTFYSEDLRLFHSPRQLTDHITSLKAVRGADRIILMCFAERQEDREVVRYPIQGFYQDIYGNDQKRNIPLGSIDIEKYVQAIIDNPGKKALYGCGHVCDILLDGLYKINKEAAIDVIFDSDVRKAGTIYRGYRLSYPTVEKLSCYDKIYISSTEHEGEIEKNLLEKHVPQEHIEGPSSFV